VRRESRTEGALGAAVPSAIVETFAACGGAGIIRRDYIWGLVRRGYGERVAADHDEGV